MSFPITCVDNFYKDPDKIREFALSLDYVKLQGNYPGRRSHSLHEIEPAFFDSFCKKLFSLFYNFEREAVNWKVLTSFQKIYPITADPNSTLNEGWIHRDKSTIAAGVIYLTPESRLESGTSIYRFKNNLEKIEELDYEIRNKLYAEEDVDMFAYYKQKQHNSSFFEKTLDVSNVYNRLIMYGSEYWHNQTSLYAHETEPRLTQVFFINEVEASSFPIDRKENFEI